MKKNKFWGIIIAVITAGAMLSACAMDSDWAMYDVADDSDTFNRLVTSFSPSRQRVDFFPTMEVSEGRDVEPPVEALGVFDYGGGHRVDWEDVAGQTERHIIQNANVEAETEEFDETVAALRGLADAAGGYVESEQLNTHRRRVFTIVMRVPRESFADVLAEAEALADVRTTSQSAQDVTDHFYDTASSLETRRIEEERLLALIDEAENVHDLLALETRLSNTRMAIETYLAELNNLAGRIAFSTITFTLFDISENYVPAAVPTLGERIGGAFGSSLDGTVAFGENIIVFFAGAVIPLGILGLFVLAGYLIVRLAIKRSRRPANL